MPAGPAMLALRTGAELIPTTIRYEGKEPNHVIVINFDQPVEPPARSPEGKGNGRVANMTQQVADSFARKIAEYPADWHMMQRLFLSDLRPDDPRRAQQRGQE
jgi:KDO2-lipid IV(A) lauroyltransferase